MSLRRALDGLRFEQEGAVARITLDRPERHNALGAGDVASLGSLLGEVESSDSVRVLVLTGSGGRTFCSGAALEEMATGEMSGAVFDTLTDRLAGVDVPTIARINGDVYGGGAELALACDFRVGVRGIRLAVPAARLGVCYPPGGLRRYVTRLGPGVASRILLAAEELDADELLHTGYLTHLVDRGDLDRRIDDLAQGLARLAPLAVRNMKRILLGIARGNADDDEIAALVAECAASQDLEEGLRAWREGRDPEFRGR